MKLFIALTLPLAGLALTACSAETEFLVADAGLEPVATATQAAPQVSAEHQRLLEGVGRFEGTMTAYAMGPEPITAPATDTITALGSFWTISTFETNLMGMPYTGTGHFGFDAETGKHIGTWIDSMSPLMARMEGEEDEEGNLVMRWMGPNMDGSAMVPHWSISEHREDGYTSTFYMGEGEGTMNMVLEMKRVEGRGGREGRGERGERGAPGLRGERGERGGDGR